jgi:hypothetical protein
MWGMRGNGVFVSTNWFVVLLFIVMAFVVNPTRCFDFAKTYNTDMPWPKKVDFNVEDVSFQHPNQLHV